MTIYLPPKITGKWVDLTGYSLEYSGYVDEAEGFFAPAYIKNAGLVCFRGVIEKNRDIADDSGLAFILPYGD